MSTELTVGRISTPDGVFTVLTDESSVLASGWTEDPLALHALIHPSLRRPVAPAGSAAEPPAGIAQQALQAVAAYYDGDLSGILDVPVRQRSGPYRQRAWEVLRQVGPGSPLSYAAYAARTGSPGAVRAAAGACAANAAALFVPCHRVIRSDGSLGGFRYGLPVKHSLLQREARSA
ncbi:methylated-DNA--[protein]-cysteine S-methyltransferase [Nesterenkonia sp.]|uniref:methylated-DNA--[protein]-cysteine S-methyltransferase n=1 Tax=Nesterenkonia sp. TaxID=704201 RepID=UPI002619A8CB|nr:methylated-DNA--[protein]-cysteine S-methyltransferase [Nesterenkonia sp.]